MATTKGDKRLLPTHTSPQRPSAKRARLELSAVPVAHLERQNRDAQANLLEAGRISALLSVKRRDEDHQKIAWSSQNIIAFSRGDGSLELAHVSNSERTHILACHGNRDHRTLDILSFSPRGDALFACYSSGIAFLWTKEIALNRWRLVTTGKKASFSLILPGKAVVSQWLAQPKRVSPFPQEGRKQLTDRSSLGLDFAWKRKFLALSGLVPMVLNFFLEQRPPNWHSWSCARKATLLSFEQMCDMNGCLFTQPLFSLCDDLTVSRTLP